MPDQYSRGDLLAICERAFVPQSKWCNRDSSSAQEQLGRCYALLKAGCDFFIQGHESTFCDTDDQTIWLEITWQGFAYFDYDGALESETFYLPTLDRIAQRNGRDWY